MRSNVPRRTTVHFYQQRDASNVANSPVSHDKKIKTGQVPIGPRATQGSVGSRHKQIDEGWTVDVAKTYESNKISNL